MCIQISIWQKRPFNKSKIPSSSSGRLNLNLMISIEMIVGSPVYLEDMQLRMWPVSVHHCLVSSQPSTRPPAAPVPAPYTELNTATLELSGTVKYRACMIYRLPRA